MWSRTYLKNEAKSVLHTCQGQSIIVCLLMALTSIDLQVRVNIRIPSWDISYEHILSMFHGMIQRVWVLVPAMSALFIISTLIHIFVGYPVSVGASHFLLSSRVRPSNVNLVAFGFRFDDGRYLNICKTIFLKNLFISLWSLLLVIPGIYKSYQYRMVPYLLAENPLMDYRRALSLSASMMEGEKWNAFVLDLSFIGWYFLSAFTCMILAVVYVVPYKYHTDTGLYVTLREQAINNGLVSPAELYAVVS